MPRATTVDSEYEDPYTETYWRWLEAQGVDSEGAVGKVEPLAKACAEAAGLAKGGVVLDYGCGRGALTAALRRVGYTAWGVDASPWPIEHCLLEARPCVRLLTEKGLSEFEPDSFDLVVAKDVFEHVERAVLTVLIAELMRVSGKLIFLCPVTNSDHTFICPNDEEDTTHITRMTAEEWLAFVPYRASRQDYVRRVARGPRFEHGSICVLLER